MGSIKFDNLDNSPISFELSEEDLTSIKGGMTSSSKIKYLSHGDLKIEDFKIEDLKIEDRIIKDFKIDIIIKIEAYRPDHPWLFDYPIEIEGGFI